MKKTLEITELDKFSGDDFEKAILDLLKNQGYKDIKQRFWCNDGSFAPFSFVCCMGGLLRIF